VIQAAVDIKTPQVGGQAGVELSIGAEKKLSSQSIAKNANWVMAGGNRLVVGNDPKWSEALADPNSWDVIARDGLDDLVDLLPTTPENIQEKVKEIWLRGQRELWGPNPPPKRARPDFHNCKVYLENTLVQREISDVAVECIVAAYSGRKRNVILSDVEADNPTLCKDYPPVVSSSLRVNAAANKLLWEFVYTGSFDLEIGLPLYRIKSADGMWFLSQDKVQHQPAWDCNTLILISKDQLNLSNPERDPSAWVIRPADPSGALGRPYSECFTIQNWFTKHYLGETKMYAYEGMDKTFNWRFFLHDLGDSLRQLTPQSAVNASLKACCWTIRAP
jgi:hypothetical protein